MITLAASNRWNNSRYVLPRLTLLTGQFAITTFISVILILYFMGFIEKLNDIVIGSYEYWANDKLSEDDRIRAVNDLFIYAIGTFIVVFMYTVYELFELHITRKYQNTLDTPPEFIPVRNQEPPRLAGPKLSIGQPQRVPPPPYNPQYR
uniref:Col_cuticle_N domain-containing protein n=1 Tax=Elaeophora elaphi TaxID=1147741 RepID=A0A0R3S716_9BILA